MVDQIIQYYIDQVNSFEMRPHRLLQINKIGASVSSMANVALRVLVRFIEKLEVLPLSWDPLTRNLALNYLEAQQHITQEVVEGLDRTKASLLADTITLPQYLEDVKARMTFIQFCTLIQTTRFYT